MTTDYSEISSSSGYKTSSSKGDSENVNGCDNDIATENGSTSNERQNLNKKTKICDPKDNNYYLPKSPYQWEPKILPNRPSILKAKAQKPLNKSAAFINDGCDIDTIDQNDRTYSRSDSIFLRVKSASNVCLKEDRKDCADKNEVKPKSTTRRAMSAIIPSYVSENAAKRPESFHEFSSKRIGSANFDAFPTKRKYSGKLECPDEDCKNNTKIKENKHRPRSSSVSSLSTKSTFKENRPASCTESIFQRIKYSKQKDGYSHVRIFSDSGNSRKSMKSKLPLRKYKSASNLINGSVEENFNSDSAILKMNKDIPSSRASSNRCMSASEINNSEKPKQTYPPHMKHHDIRRLEAISKQSEQNFDRLERDREALTQHEKELLMLDKISLNSVEKKKIMEKARDTMKNKNVITPSERSKFISEQVIGLFIYFTSYKSIIKDLLFFNFN